MIDLPIPSGPGALEETLAALPDRPAVFLLWPREGKPYLARTNVLRRRLNRLLGLREKASRMLNLRETAERIEYRLTGSKLEAQMLMLQLARLHLGPGYRREIRLRLPPYVKLVLSNPFPRTQVTTRLGNAPGLYFGPFRNRSTAALFESEFLDLFQLRRCQEDLLPSPEHPGCMYGEMGRCLRPCQAAVGLEEYRSEASRVAEFLRSGGRSLLAPATAARARLSEEMDFEGAALMHKRMERIEEILALRDEMARDVDRLHAVAVLGSGVENAIELGWLRNGRWQGLTRLELQPVDGRAISLDTRLREAADSIGSQSADAPARMEQLAVVSRWFYSSWRDGEMLLVDEWEKLPLRKLVNAVSRVAAAQR